MPALKVSVTGVAVSGDAPLATDDPVSTACASARPAPSASIASTPSARTSERVIPSRLRSGGGGRQGGGRATNPRRQGRCAGSVANATRLAAATSAAGAIPAGQMPRVGAAGHTARAAPRRRAPGSLRRACRRTAGRAVPPFRWSTLARQRATAATSGRARGHDDHTERVNGESHRVDVDPEMPLLWVLRGVARTHRLKYGWGARSAARAILVNKPGRAERASTPVPSAAALHHKGPVVRPLEPDPAGVDRPQCHQCSYCQSRMIGVRQAKRAARARPATRSSTRCRTCCLAARTSASARRSASAMGRAP